MSLPLNDHQVLQLDQLPELVHHLWEEKMEVVGMHLDWEDLCPFRRSKCPRRHGLTWDPGASACTSLRHSKRSCRLRTHHSEKAGKLSPDIVSGGQKASNELLGEGPACAALWVSYELS